VGEVGLGFAVSKRPPERAKQTCLPSNLLLLSLSLSLSLSLHVFCIAFFFFLIITSPSKP